MSNLIGQELDLILNTPSVRAKLRARRSPEMALNYGQAKELKSDKRYKIKVLAETMSNDTLLIEYKHQEFWASWKWQDNISQTENKYFITESAR